jgi:hypothetical protein
MGDFPPAFGQTVEAIKVVRRIAPKPICNFEQNHLNGYPDCW